MSMSAPESIRIPMDMVKAILRTLQRVHGRVLCDEDRAVALTTGDALYEIANEASDPEQPHPGVETQPPLTMRLHICGKHDRDEDRYQMPSIGEVILGESSRAHYKVIEVRWQGPRVADVLTMPVPGWATPEKF